MDSAGLPTVGTPDQRVYPGRKSSWPPVGVRGVGVRGAGISGQGGHIGTAELTALSGKPDHGCNIPTSVKPASRAIALNSLLSSLVDNGMNLHFYT